MDEKQVTLPVKLGGEYRSGDPSVVPDGYCLRVQNMLQRAGRLESRPPFVYDSLMGIRSLAIFDDNTNKVFRGVAIDNAQQFYEKATTGETWSGVIAGTLGSRMTSWTDYRGKSYFAMDNGSGVPSKICSFDGVTINPAPINSTISARVVVAFLDRLFLIYPRVTVTARPAFGSGNRYSGTTSASFSLRTITSGATTTYRVYTVSGIGTQLIGRAVTGLAASADQPFQARWDLRNSHASYDLPCRLRVYVTTAIQRNTAYVAGDIAIDNVTGFLFRCTTGGTTAVGAPAFNVALGSTTADNTVTWTNDGSFVLYDKDITILNATTQPTWTTFTLNGIVPKHTNILDLSCDVWTGTTASALPTTGVGIDVGFTDGLADGTLGKQNYGFQFTLGDYYCPFVNTESSDTNSFDLNSIVFSDILQPAKVRAAATYELWAHPGFPTAGITAQKKLFVFKRNSFWSFIGNQDPTSLDYIPLREDRIEADIGCIGPRALDKVDDNIYFISENGVMVLKAGAEPEEIGGDAMREAIMDRGSNWVESQATYNMPILRINKQDREVWVYTQKGTIFVYNIKLQTWSEHTVTAAGGVAAEVADMIFNPNTRKMEVAFGGYGLARCDWTASPAQDIIDNTATNYPVTMRIVGHPIETAAPRVDMTIDRVKVYHNVAPGTSQTGQALTAYVSYDRGVTYPNSEGIVLDVTAGMEQGGMNEIEIFETAPTLTVDLRMVGKAGASLWSVSRFEVEATMYGDEYPQASPAQSGGTP